MKGKIKFKYSDKILEEELKNKVASDFFSNYDSTKIIGKIDFCISPFNSELSFMWAEAKKGYDHDIYESFIQLILTIGKNKVYEKNLPPNFIGAFDASKIAFVPYNLFIDIFSQNDFNWNVTPSDHTTKEFKQLYDLVKTEIENNLLLFYYNDNRLNEFIKTNFIFDTNQVNKILITKNNFTSVFLKWYEQVKNSIAVDWEILKKNNIFESDFFLADLLSRDNISLKEKLFVVLNKNKYLFNRKINNLGLIDTTSADFRDNQNAHTQFWNIYERPPAEEYWDFIIERRDLLVPQDVRERKGSFFTPKQWVELSQKYITDYLGEDWQDEYYVWDCAAGTGNLLVGLTNKYNIWASTIDQADVDVMKDRISNGANLLESHVFQFDFLNDDFSKLPDGLRTIIGDDNKCKKLIIYINPPYAEPSNIKTKSGNGYNRSGLASESKIFHQYNELYGKNTLLELYIQFLCRIYCEIKNCLICSFSTLKILQSQNSKKFRENFLAKLEKLFLVPSYTFDNVGGTFPIGFFIFNTKKEVEFNEILSDVYDENCKFLMNKKISSYKNNRYIIEWLKYYHDKKGEYIAYLRMVGTDVQNNNGVFITNKLSENDIKKKLFTLITPLNILETAIYCTIRKIIQKTWYNDRDQFLYPSNSWNEDTNFQYNCLVYSIFINVISFKNGINNFIPFSESEVEANEKFDSNFMYKYINGKYKLNESQNKLVSKSKKENLIPKEKLMFSEEAQEVLDTGKELFKYYHSQDNINVNASYYDIRAYFCGTNAKGRMNISSEDEKYNELNDSLRSALKKLASKIIPKVYEYEFLR